MFKIIYILYYLADVGALRSRSLADAGKKKQNRSISDFRWRFWLFFSSKFDRWTMRAQPSRMISIMFWVKTKRFDMCFSNKHFCFSTMWRRRNWWSWLILLFFIFQLLNNRKQTNNEDESSIENLNAGAAAVAIAAGGESDDKENNRYFIEWTTTNIFEDCFEIERMLLIRQHRRRQRRWIDRWERIAQTTTTMTMITTITTRKIPTTTMTTMMTARMSKLKLLKSITSSTTATIVIDHTNWRRLIW